jgi:hypothetical protein
MTPDEAVQVLSQLTNEVKADNDRCQRITELEGEYARAMREYDNYCDGPGWPDDADRSYDASMLRRVMHHKAMRLLASAMSVQHELIQAKRTA